jgi:hypothetical protein
MMELKMIRSLMDIDFHSQYRRTKCPDELFTNEGTKIIRCIDKMIDNYKRSVTPDEVSAYFMSHTPALTTAQEHSYSGLFHKLRGEHVMGNDVAKDVVSRLFQRHIGQVIVNMGVNYSNGEEATMEPLRELLSKYNDDFTPNLNLEWEDISIESILESYADESRWAFNLLTLADKIPGVNSGHLIEIGARPNTGKTSFHASMIAGPKGFAWLGANCVVLTNEEKTKRVASRYLTAATGMTVEQVNKDPAKAHAIYNNIRNNIKMYDASGKDMAWVESVAKTYRPDILILDMGDKFARMGGYSRQDEALKANVIYAREIGKQYNCAVFYMSQLSAEAEGKTILNQSMMEGSKTGKAAEADLMILIAANPLVEGQNQQDSQRHLNVVKNKLTGWHGRLHCNLDAQYGRYVV